MGGLSKRHVPHGSGKEQALATRACLGTPWLNALGPECSQLIERLTGKLCPNFLQMCENTLSNSDQFRWKKVGNFQ